MHVITTTILSLLIYLYVFFFSNCIYMQGVSLKICDLSYSSEVSKVLLVFPAVNMFKSVSWDLKIQ